MIAWTEKGVWHTRVSAGALAPSIHVYLEPQDGAYLEKGSLQMSLGPDDKSLEEKRKGSRGGGERKPQAEVRLVQPFRRDT